MTVDRAAFELDRLALAVAKLYEIFASYPLRPNTFPCPCCHSPSDELKLRGKPLAELSAEALADYASSAMLTWGEEVDFKHFLPRIFEIAAAGDVDFPNLEIVYAKLGDASWRTWPAGEQRAVEEYLLAEWRGTLARYPSVHAAEDVLCAIAQSCADMGPFLTAWNQVEGEAPTRHLADLLWSNGRHLVEKGSLANAFWSNDQRPQQEQIRRWLCDAVVLDRLEAAFFAASTPEVAAELSDAVAILEAVRR